MCHPVTKGLGVRCGVGSRGGSVSGSVPPTPLRAGRATPWESPRPVGFVAAELGPCAVWGRISAGGGGGRDRCHAVSRRGNGFPAGAAGVGWPQVVGGGPPLWAGTGSADIPTGAVQDLWVQSSSVWQRPWGGQGHAELGFRFDWQSRSPTTTRRSCTSSHFMLILGGLRGVGAEPPKPCNAPGSPPPLNKSRAGAPAAHPRGIRALLPAGLQDDGKAIHINKVQHRAVRVGLGEPVALPCLFLLQPSALLGPNEPPDPPRVKWSKVRSATGQREDVSILVAKDNAVKVVKAYEGRVVPAWLPSRPLQRHAAAARRPRQRCGALPLRGGGRHRR